MPEMEEYREKKNEMNLKLETETNNLNALKDTLNKSSLLTNNVVSILSSFEDRLLKLENTIVPVYNESGILQMRQHNIEKTYVALDHVIGLYHVCHDVETLITNGPSGCLEEYLHALMRLKEAKKYLTQNDIYCPEIGAGTLLTQKGEDLLEKEFRNILTRHSKAVPPILILDMIGLDEELPHDDINMDHLPEKIMLELIEISKWLIANTEICSFMNTYSSIRGNVLVKSLQGLKEHLKSSSGGSRSLNAQPSPNLAVRHRGNKETPLKKGSKKGSMFSRIASASILKHTSLDTAWLSHGSGHRRQGSLVPDIKEETTETDVEAYMTSVSALLKLMQSEYQLMQDIIPVTAQAFNFDSLIQSALDTVITEGENIAAVIKKSLAKHDFFSIISIFPILKHLRSLRPEFDQTVKNCQAPTRAKLAVLISTLDNTGTKGLEDFVDSLKNDPDKQMPKDGTVHELTSNAMMFLDQLLEYIDTVACMLCTAQGRIQSLAMDAAGEAMNLGSESSYKGSNKDSAENKRIVAQYMTRVISALGLNLTTKSETYSDQYLKAIFMLNNYHYIHKSLQRNNLLHVLRYNNPNVEQYYQDLILEQKRLYSQSWSRVLHYVMEVNKPISQQRSSPQMNKLKDKERQNIKDKFTGFNKEIEEIYRIQKGYAIPDVDLRETLKTDNKDFIIPRYTLFRDKYMAMQFTKNRDKYIKYTPEQVSELIDKFFDTAA